MFGKKNPDRLFLIGEQLMHEVIHHKADSGGTSCSIFGYLGSGKTTLLLQLSNKIFYKSNGELKPETIVWRGRQNDYWCNIKPISRVVLYFHVKDYDADYGRFPEFFTDAGDEIPNEELPEVCTYSDVSAIYNNILANPGKVHVIYAPVEYEFTDTLKNILLRRSMEDPKRYEHILVDSSLWWYEFFAWLIEHKKNDFMSCIIDEADDIILGQSGGLRWHCQKWLKDVIKDFRKRKISLFLAAHNPLDIDSAVMSKVNYHIYCSGANICSRSMVDPLAVKTMAKGEVFIEHDKFGKFSYPKIPDMWNIVVSFKETEELKKRVIEARKNKFEDNHKKNQWNGEKQRYRCKEILEERVDMLEKLIKKINPNCADLSIPPPHRT